MKIIHCADIHLDSRMSKNLDRARAKDRNREILETFLKMIDYAGKHEVSAVIIAGDLFDTEKVLTDTKKLLMEAICENKNIDFYYLRGNHDKVGFFSDSENIPDNIFLFDDKWTYYKKTLSNQKEVVIAGMEYTGNSSKPDELILNKEDFNIVTLHGQVGSEIVLKDYENKNIDYMALGHIHKMQKGRLFPRGTYCYSGCLESRGFDECGEHGFMLLEIDEESLKFEVKPIGCGRRRAFTFDVDISGVISMGEIKEKVTAAIKEGGATQKDMISVSLVGRSPDINKAGLHIFEQELEDTYYFAKIKDLTQVKIDYSEYKYDATLTGAFILGVGEDKDLSESEKNKIIQCGLSALSGEELAL